MLQESSNKFEEVLDNSDKDNFEFEEVSVHATFSIESTIESSGTEINGIGSGYINYIVIGDESKYEFKSCWIFRIQFLMVFLLHLI